MEDLPTILVNKIYDDFLDLCLIEHSIKFSQSLDDISNNFRIEVGFKNHWLTDEHGNSGDKYNIFRFDNRVITGIILMVKEGKVWRHQSSWTFFPNQSWTYSTV